MPAPATSSPRAVTHAARAGPRLCRGRVAGKELEEEGEGMKDGGRGTEVAATAGEAEAMKSSFEKPRPGGGDLDRTIGIGRLVINVDVAQW